MFQADETAYDFFTPTLKNNFRHFSLRFPNAAEAEDGFSVLKTELPKEMGMNMGRVFRVRRLGTQEVLVYFVSKQFDLVNWKAVIKQILKANQVGLVKVVALGLSNTENKGKI